LAVNCPEPDEDGPLADRLFDGRLIVHQPSSGHRIGTDAVLLAAAAPSLTGGLIVDVGAGVGAVGLALAQINPGAQTALLEKNARAAACARRNVAANDLSARVRIVEADLFDAARRKAEGLVEAADLVVTNPPFLNAGDSRVSPDSDRAMAHVLDEGGIEKWLRASLALLRPGGFLAAIHRADALDALLASLAGRLGGVEIFPIFPRHGEKATRVILRGRKGGKAPLVLLPGLVLHGADGKFTPRAEELHRRGGRLFET
jgi:tRNA1(Val) A37 N6-methylase TrmN6